MKSTSDLSELGIDLAEVYQRLPVALCIVGRDGRLLAVNDLHADLAGRPVSELIGVKVADLHEEGGRNVQRDFRVFDLKGSVPNHELEVRGKHYMVSVSPVFNRHREVVAISVAHFDISEKKALDRKIERANRRLHGLSTRDHLTNLQNRRQFDAAIKARCRSLRRHGEDFSLIFLDVDCFKMYNDHYGHQAGDICLKGVANIIRQTVRRDEITVYRYGGEEFAIIIDRSDLSVALRLAHRITRQVRNSSMAHERSPFSVVTVSCGVASTNQLHLSLGAAPSPEDIITAADEALYRAKHGGRNGVAASPVALEAQCSEL